MAKRFIEVEAEEVDGQMVFSCPFCKYRGKFVVHRHGLGYGYVGKHCDKRLYKMPKDMDMNYDFLLVPKKKS